MGKGIPKGGFQREEVTQGEGGLIRGKGGLEERGSPWEAGSPRERGPTEKGAVGPWATPEHESSPQHHGVLLTPHGG